MQNSSLSSDVLPQHIAIIMDGNGRWAKAQGMTVILFVKDKLIKDEIVTSFVSRILVQPSPAPNVVKVKVTVPLKFAAGVYVTAEGVAVCAVLLKFPPPEVIDHAPVEAPPPIVPFKLIESPEHTSCADPALTEGSS